MQCRSHALQFLCDTDQIYDQPGRPIKADQVELRHISSNWITIDPHRADHRSSGQDVARGRVVDAPLRCRRCWRDAPARRSRAWVPGRPRGRPPIRAPVLGWAVWQRRRTSNRQHRPVAAAVASGRPSASPFGPARVCPCRSAAPPVSAACARPSSFLARPVVAALLLPHPPSWAEPPRGRATARDARAGATGGGGLCPAACPRGGGGRRRRRRRPSTVAVGGRRWSPAAGHRARRRAARRSAAAAARRPPPPPVVAARPTGRGAPVRRRSARRASVAVALWRVRAVWATVCLHCWAPFVAIVFCLRGTQFAYVADDRRPESALIAP